MYLVQAVTGAECRGNGRPASVWFGTLGRVKQGLGQAVTNGAGGSIDYRLARDRVIRAYLTGEATRSEVCDAQAELMRNARYQFADG